VRTHLQHPQHHAEQCILVVLTFHTKTVQKDCEKHVCHARTVRFGSVFGGTPPAALDWLAQGRDGGGCTSHCMFSTLHTAPDRGWAAAGTAAAGTAGAGWRTVTLESVVALRICSQNARKREWKMLCQTQKQVHKT
jgi:hypothetical protein